PPLHSFPTRRSSDLAQATLAAVSAEQSTGMLVGSLSEADLADSRVLVGQFVAGTSVHVEGRIKNYGQLPGIEWQLVWPTVRAVEDRKSTRLNSSHVS